MKFDNKFVLMAGLILSAGFLPLRAEEAAAGSSFEAEKAKAMASPYANDLGPASIDVSSYPPEHQKAYKEVLLVKCAKCHAPSRPLNSQFLEPMGKKEEKQGKLDAWKASTPDLFQDKNLWQPETDIWQRYVKRMMSKPGCGISPEEGKAVWGFLVYDSNQRKVGAKKAEWKAHRTKLLNDFKLKHPERYKELYEKK